MESGGFQEQKGHPIIIVPPSPQIGNLCIYNAKQFLDEGKYENADNQQHSNLQEYCSKVSFKKKIKDKDVTFDVYDSVTSFTKHDWK